MSDFPFEFSIDYKMENCTIKPPCNFALLETVVSEKYDLNTVTIAFLDPNGLEHPIGNEQDYAQLINDACNANVKEVELVLHTVSDTSKKRKKSLRKRSSMPNESSDSNSVIKLKHDEECEKDGGEIGTYCDYDYFGDIRNKKALMEDNRYLKHSKNFTDKRRIYDIMEKKEMLKEERELKSCSGMEIDEDYEYDNEQRKKRNKRQLKCNNRDNDDDQMEISEDNNKNKKKKKKKNK